MNIKIENYTKKIKNNIILDNICLNMSGGTVYGLKGVNGSGKTMLMRAFCGLIYPTFGYISIDGKMLGEDISFPESVGALIENPAFIKNYTGMQNLRALASIQGKITPKDIKNAMCRVGLYPDDKRIYRKYSLGMKQKLGIAAAIMEKPDLIILDEPFNALDTESTAMAKQIIEEEKSRGALIILSCHDLSELLDISDRIISIENGKIIGNIPSKEYSGVSK